MRKYVRARFFFFLFVFLSPNQNYQDGPDEFNNNIVSQGTRAVAPGRQIASSAVRTAAGFPPSPPPKPPPPRRPETTCQTMRRWRRRRRRAALTRQPVQGRPVHIRTHVWPIHNTSSSRVGSLSPTTLVKNKKKQNLFANTT